MSRSPSSWVTSTFRPHVMVACTPAVEETCAKNNLSFVDLLKPFQELSAAGSISFRSVSEKSSTLANFGLRFVSHADVQTARKDATDKGLEKLTLRLAPDFDQKMQNDYSVRTGSDVPRFFNRHPDPTPWYSSYRALFMDALRFDRHSFLDHPVAAIYAVSVSDADPVGKLKDLSALDKLPALFRGGHYDRNIFRHFLLIYDNHEGSKGLDRANQLMRQTKKSFPNDLCRILKMNSVQVDTPRKGENDIWRPYTAMRLRSLSGRADELKQSRVAPSPRGVGSPVAASPRDRAPSAGRPEPFSSASVASLSSRGHQTPKDVIHGQYLSNSDMKNLSEFVSDFAIKYLLPHLETKLRLLNGQIAQERRGLRNQVKLFFSRKPKTLPRRNEDAPMYDLSSIESKIRQMADFSFIMQDYRLARDHYQLVCADYQTDKALAYLAGAQEMWGISILLCNGDRRDVETRLDHARKTYAQIGDLRRSTRVAMWGADAVRVNPNKTHESMFLLRASEQETEVRAALLLEQAAYAFLATQPSPMLRKYAFHMVLAGHMFLKCDQRKHALRCYSLALSVYDGYTWTHIEDHIRYNLGQQTANLGLYEDSIRYFLPLIANGRQTLERQNTFLQEFLNVVKKFSGGAPRRIEKLEVPKFDNETFEVTIADSSSVLSSLCASVWANAKSSDSGPLLNLRAVWDKPDQNRCVYAGEFVYVSVSISNPMKLQVVAQNVRLRCEHGLSSGSGSSTSTPVNGRKPSDAHLFEVRPVSVQLNANATRRLCLAVKCLKTGPFRVLGIEWSLFDVAVGFHSFPQYATRLDPLEDKWRKLGGGRMAGGGGKDKRIVERMELRDQCLRFDVVPAQPKLVCRMINFPRHIYHGEVVTCTMQLSNVGTTPVRDLSLKISHPMFFFLQRHDSEDIASYKADHNRVMDVIRSDKGDAPLLPHNMREFTVYVRGAHTNGGSGTRGVSGEKGTPLVLEVLFRYSGAMDSPGSGVAADKSNGVSAPPSSEKPHPAFRLLHLALHLDVYPLLRVKLLSCNSSVKSVSKNILAVQVDNLQELATLGSLTDRETYAQMAAPEPSPRFATPLSVELTRVSTFCRNWQLQPISSATAASDEKQQLDDAAAAASPPPPAEYPIRILGKESKTLFFYLVPADDSKQGAPAEDDDDVEQLEDDEDAKSGGGDGKRRDGAVDVPQEQFALNSAASSSLDLLSLSTLGSGNNAVNSIATASVVDCERPPFSHFVRAINDAKTAALRQRAHTSGKHMALRRHANELALILSWRFAGGVDESKQQLTEGVDASGEAFAPPFSASASPLNSSEGGAGRVTSSPSDPLMAPSLFTQTSQNSPMASGNASSLATGGTALAAALPGSGGGGAHIDSAPPSAVAFAFTNRDVVRQRPAAAASAALVGGDAAAAPGNALDYPLLKARGRCGFMCPDETIAVGFEPKARCPLRFSIHFPATVSHDFSRKAMAEVPLRVTVMNIARDSRVSFIFETLSSREEFSSSTRSFRMRPATPLRTEYFWKGRTRHRVERLPVDRSTTITLLACFLRPGTYNVNRFRFSVLAQHGNAPRVFFFPVQHLIDIRDAGASDAGVHADAGVNADAGLPLRAASPLVADVPLRVASQQNAPPPAAISTVVPATSAPGGTASVGSAFPSLPVAALASGFDSAETSPIPSSSPVMSPSAAVAPPASQAAASIASTSASAPVASFPARVIAGLEDMKLTPDPTPRTTLKRPNAAASELARSPVRGSSRLIQQLLSSASPPLDAMTSLSHSSKQAASSSPSVSPPPEFASTDWHPFAEHATVDADVAPPQDPSVLSTPNEHKASPPASLPHTAPERSTSFAGSGTLAQLSTSSSFASTKSSNLLSSESSFSGPSQPSAAASLSQSVTPSSQLYPTAADSQTEESPAAGWPQHIPATSTDARNIESVVAELPPPAEPMPWDSDAPLLSPDSRGASNAPTGASAHTPTDAALLFPSPSSDPILSAESSRNVQALPVSQPSTASIRQSSPSPFSAAVESPSELAIPQAASDSSFTPPSSLPSGNVSGISLPTDPLAGSSSAGDFFDALAAQQATHDTSSLASASGVAAGNLDAPPPLGNSPAAPQFSIDDSES